MVFPAWLQQWDPDRSMDSQLLFSGMEQVVFEMEAAMPQQQRNWRDGQVLSRHAMEGPLRLSTYAMNGSISLIAFFIKGEFFNRMWGIDNPFLAFLARGWVFAVLGTGAILLGAYLRHDRPIPFFRRDLKWAAGLGIIVVTLFSIPKMMNEFHLQKADLGYYQGNFPLASTHWRKALWWQPGTSRSWPYYLKFGHAVRKLGCHGCYENQMSIAYLESSAQNFKASLDRLQRIQIAYPDHAEIRFQLGAVHTSYGASLFNHGQYTTALEQWEEAIRILPTMPLPWYGLSLVYLRLREFDKAAACIEQLMKLQSYFTFKNLTIGGQVYTVKSWAAYWNKRWGEAQALHSLSLSPERWSWASSSVSD
jgi:hypothetical protein